MASLDTFIDEKQLLEEMGFFKRSTIIVIVVLPFLATLYALCSKWAGLTDILVFLLMYCSTGLGITVGYHRLLTHRSFVTYNWIRYLLAILGTASAQGSVLTWVSDHRKHHKYTDKPGDPHSPHLVLREEDGLFPTIELPKRRRGTLTTVWKYTKGLTHAHVGWLMSEREISDWRIYAKDLYEDPGLRAITHHSTGIVFSGLLLPGIISGLLTSSWEGIVSGVLWGGLIRMFLLHHVTWSINSICHFSGTRDYQTEDYSTNVTWLSIPSLGESWHNNHHAFPRSACHGLKPGQVDISYMVIRLLEITGLAWNVMRYNEGEGPHLG